MGGRSAYIQPPLYRSGPGCQCLSGLMPTWNALPTPINPSSASSSYPLPTALGGDAAPRRPSLAQLTGSCPWRRRLGGAGLTRPGASSSPAHGGASTGSGG